LQVGYIKSPVAQVFHADGMFGGPTPQRLLYVAFYAEHAKLPETTVFNVDETAKTLTPVSQASHEGQWIREVVGEVIMTLEVARSFRDWLNTSIDVLEKIEPEDSFRSIER
jgi:hypothetical protein